jgi:hypothetical protein
MLPYALPGFHPIDSPGFPFNLILFFAPIVLDIVLGILLIVSAVKLKNGKIALIKEKKKLIISSWIIVGVSLSQSIISIFWYGFFFFFQEPGLVGAVIIILGNFFYNQLNKRNFLYGSTSIKLDEDTSSSSYFAVKTLCTKCGFSSGEDSLKFCPECGDKLVSKKKPS